MCYLKKKGVYYKDSHGMEKKREKIAGTESVFQDLSLSLSTLAAL